MCGIAGILASRAVDPAVAERMSAVLAHRGPDDEGYTLVDAEGALHHCAGGGTVMELQNSLPQLRTFYAHGTVTGFLVHRRLSIIDLSASGHQPMSSTDGRYVIAFNGELYNYLELRADLAASGSVFRTASDTEVALESFARWGPDCLARFIGMWGFVVYDVREGRLFLARDRFGIKPLYYALHRDLFLWGSEIKALWASGLLPREADEEQLASFLLYGDSAARDQTLFARVRQLPPGFFAWREPDGAFHATRYYDLAEQAARAQIPQDEPAQVLEYRRHLEESVRLHLRADVPVGACVSGGLDSGALVGLRATLWPGQTIRTFTASYPGEAMDERGRVEDLARRFPEIQPTFTTPAAEGLLEEYDTVLWHQDLPFNSTSIYAQWSVMRAAHAAGINVLLDGQGADEVLGGYYPFAGVFLLEQLRALHLRTLLREHALLRRRLSSRVTAYAAAALLESLPAPLARLGKLAGKDTQRYLHPDTAAHVRVPYPRRWGGSMHALSVSSISFGLQQLLRYEDRNSMAFSIESRVPFLDHRLVEFSLALPARVKLRDGWVKYVLRRAAEDILPTGTLWQTGKIGFTTPQRQWRGKLSRELVESAAISPLADSVVDMRHFRAAASSRVLSASQESEFWRAYCLLRWGALFLGSQGAAGIPPVQCARRTEVNGS